MLTVSAKRRTKGHAVRIPQNTDRTTRMMVKAWICRHFMRAILCPAIGCGSSSSTATISTARKIDRSRTYDFAGISLRKCLLRSVRSVFRRLSCLELKGP